MSAAPQSPPKLPRAGHSTIAGFFIDLARFGWRQLITDKAPEMAAALAYRTIFSLIPVLVLSIVIFKAFLTEDRMKEVLANLMEYTGISQIQFTAPPQYVDQLPEEPQSPGIPESPDSGVPEAPVTDSMRLADTLQGFVNKTVERIQEINFGIITVVGVLVLIYAALSLVIQVEQAFNQICRAPSGRTFRARFPAYFMVLSLGPLCLVGGFVLSRTALQTLSEYSPLIGTPLRIISTVGITWLVVLLAYWLMPNAKIKPKNAAIGALIAAILWEGAKAALAWFVAYLVDPKTGGQIAVYGSIALLPIFLMWIYTTWLIVLFGFEVTYAVQTVSSGRHRFLDRQSENPIIDPAMGVVIMNILATRFANGKACTVEELARRSAISESTVETVLRHLVAKGFVHKVESKSDADESAYAPARSPDALSAADVLTVMHDLAGEPPPDGQSGITDLAVLRLLRQSQIEALRTFNISGIKKADT